MDMTTPQAQNPLAFYRSLPKVELHRHLEGSLRFETLLEIASVYDIHTDGARALRSSVQIQDDDPHTFENFLSKFVALRQFYCSPEVIERLAREAVEDASKDNIRYLELRFTPATLSRSGKFPLIDVIDRVISGARAGQEAYEVMTRLIVSINRHDSIKLAQHVAQLAILRKDKGIVGLDLAGNETDFSAMPFAGFFKEASQEGLKVTVHAGEWDGAANIIEAIEKISAVRIGHGVRVGEDQRAVALAQERAIPFEVCVTSNYQSGVVPSLSEHPLTRLLELDLNITLNTDDPSISNSTLGHEYYLVCEQLGLPLSVIQERIIAAAQAAFLPVKEKQVLVNKLRTELSAHINK
jgi:adenosine deaminase